MLPTTGIISLRDVATELNLTPNSLLSLNDSRVRSLAGKLTGSIGLGDLRGKVQALALTVATSAKLDNLYTQDGSACVGVVSIITTSDDSELTLEDLYKAMLNSTASPTQFPHVYSTLSAANVDITIPYGNKLMNVTLVNHAKYPAKTFTKADGTTITVYPKSNYSSASVNGGVISSTTYTKTGQFVDAITSLLLIDNISKSNTNLVITTGANTTFSFLINNIKTAVASLTDKKNVAVILQNYGQGEPTAWVFDLSNVRHVSSGTLGKGYAYTTVNTRSGVIFE